MMTCRFVPMLVDGIPRLFGNLPQFCLQPRNASFLNCKRILLWIYRLPGQNREKGVRISL